MAVRAASENNGRQAARRGIGRVSRSLFITGATGYLGRRVLQQALPFEQIRCLYRGARVEAPASVEWVKGELLHRDSYSAALDASCTVLHMAAATGKRRRADFFRINAEGTRALIEECVSRGVRRFIHVSTIAVKFADTRRYHYAESKRQAEAMVAASGIPSLIVRPTLILGPGAPNLASLSRLAAAPVMPMFGGGEARLQPIHVDDVAAAIAGFAAQPELGGEIVELGGPEIVTMRELLERLRATLTARPARSLSIAAAPLAALLGSLEEALFPVLPFTAGQLASFTNDGVADRRAASASMIPVSTMLAHA